VAPVEKHSSKFAVLGGQDDSSSVIAVGVTSCRFIPDGQSAMTNVLATAHYDRQRNQVVANCCLLLGSHNIAVFNAFTPGVKITHAKSRPSVGVSHHFVYVLCRVESFCGTFKQKDADG